MDIESQYTKLPAYIQSLSRMPREVVHQVLDNLPLVQVLRIISYKGEFLKDCVLSHLTYQRIFSTMQDIQDVVRLFIILRDINAYQSTQIASEWTWLSQSPATNTQFVANVTVRSISDNLTSCIRYGSAFRDVDRQLLNPHASTPYPATFGPNYLALGAQWKWIKEAKANLNMARAKEWNMTADLIAEYPGKLMLKKPLDPSQDGPRKNMQHIERTFRMNAKKILNDHHLSLSTNHTRCTTNVELLAVVPYNTYLLLFLDTISRHPLQNDTRGLDAISVQLKNTSLNTSQGRTQFAYPSSVVTDIKIVLEGLMNIFTGDPKLIVPRIDWKQDPPVFDMNLGPHQYISDVPGKIHRCFARRYLCHDEREFEWLRAFLRVVTWMEDNMKKDEKNAVSAK